ncbi:MAG: DUF4340 domain-containing protein [Desulfobacteraceae bacterium]|nr:DUF4340 domain-containing protein [Desulfobacteraceae bacterium]
MITKTFRPLASPDREEVTMNNRNRILLVLLALQLALIGYSYWPDSKAAAPEFVFFKDLEPRDVHRIVIADDNGGKITLSRAKTGWEITAVSGPGAEPSMRLPLPAEDAKVESLLKRLTGLASRHLVSRTQGSQGRLKVADDQFVRRIELDTPGGDPKTIYLGSAPSFKTIHARAGGSNEVYLAEGITAWDASAELPSWWRTDYLAMDPEKLQAVTIANKEGTLQLVRGERGWQLADRAEGEILSQAAVAQLLNQVSHLTASDYIGREGEVREAAHGLNNPSARLVLDTGEESVELRIGPEVSGSDERVVKSSASPYYVKVAALRLKPLLTATREALLDGKDISRKTVAKTR